MYRGFLIVPFSESWLQVPICWRIDQGSQEPKEYPEEDGLDGYWRCLWICSTEGACFGEIGERGSCSGLTENRRNPFHLTPFSGVQFYSLQLWNVSGVLPLCTALQLSPLLTQASQDNKFVCEEAELTLKKMTDALAPKTILNVLMPLIAANKHPGVRAKATTSVFNAASRFVSGWSDWMR